MKTLQNLVVAFIAIVCSIGAFAKEGANSTAALSVEALWGASEEVLSGAGTIEEAIAAAVNDNSIAYIQLQKDVTGTWTIPGGVFTFDLNSYTLSQQTENVFNVSNEGTEVTFTDNSNGKTGKIVSNYYYDTEINIVLAGAAVNIGQGATVNFLEGCYEGGIVVNAAGASTVNISGGTFNNTYYDGIINERGTLNITGGTFNSTRDNIIATYGGSVTISGGTFHLTRGTDKTIYYMGGGLNLAGYTTSEIKNITLISRADVSFSEQGITLPNGYCFYNEDNMPVTGFVSGDYTIKEEPEALWGASEEVLSGAGTIEEAIAAAVNDNSIAYIQLQKDVTGTWTIPGGVFTFDLNSHTLSQQIYNVFNVSNEGTEVTFTDNSNGKTGKIVSNYYYDAEIDIVLADAAVNISQGATVNFLEGCYEGGEVVETAGASTVNISGGTFNNTYYDGIINERGTLNITGGTFNSTRDNIIATYGGSVTISGGTFHLTKGTDKTIYYMGGGLNLAGYTTSEIKNITLRSSADVSFSERGITLPNGYCFYNEDNMPVTGFVDGDYTIKEEPEALWGASEEVLSGAGTIEEAITAAVNDNSIAYIQLQKDVTGTWTIPGGVFTFDLNGYTMQKSWETLFTLEGSNTSVTFIDGSEHKTGKMIAEASSAIYISDGARAEFQSGYYKGNITLIVSYGCSADITGGTFESAYDWCIKNLGTLAISDGDFIGGSSATIGVEGNTTVTGGNFTDTSYFATFYYYEDKLDLSGHTDAGGITIYNGSAGNIPLENENIVLPEGYILFDKNGDRATEIVQHTSYKLGHPCTVSFAAGEGGSGSMDDVITGEGFNYTLPECAFTAPKGKMFKAWLVNEVEYQAGSTVVIDSDITITAKWCTTITIDMSDVYGDGWNGNSIIVKREGETIETVTIEGFNGTVTFEYDPRFEYTFHWNRGEYSEECSFNILVSGIEVFCATIDDCSSFENEELVYASTVNMETYTIIDGEYTEYIGKNANVGTLTYIRTLPNTEWNSLFVPFEIPVTEELLADYEVAYVNDMHSYDTDDNGSIDNLEMEIIKIKGGTLRENYPYFIRAKNDEARALQLTYNNAILYRAKETTLSCSSIYTDFEIKGTYRRIAAEDFSAMPGDYHYAISVEGGWWQIEEGSALNPFRAYMTLTARDDSPVKIEERAMRAIRFSVIGSNGNDGTTGIEEIKGSSVYNEGIYDLQGRKIDKIVEGGIYIINGKKVFVK